MQDLPKALKLELELEVRPFFSKFLVYTLFLLSSGGLSLESVSPSVKWAPGVGVDECEGRLRLWGGMF